MTNEEALWRKKAERERDNALAKVAALEAENKQAQADAAAMRRHVTRMRPGQCGRCPGHWNNHAADCPIGAALATNAGQPLLDELARLRSKVDRLATCVEDRCDLLREAYQYVLPGKLLDKIGAALDSEGA